MSFVGGRYEYDLFVGYSHGSGLVDNDDGYADLPLRDWTRNVAAAVIRQLSMGLNPLGQGKFSAFIDEKEPSATRLEDDIKEICKTSALMLVFMSPTYLRSKWSGKEIGWFFEQAAEEGRGLDHTILRLVQDTPEPAGHALAARASRQRRRPGYVRRRLLQSRYQHPDRARLRPPRVPGNGPEDHRSGHRDPRQIVHPQGADRRRGSAQGSRASSERGPAIVYVQGYDDAEKWNAARDALSGVATIVPDQFEPLPSSLSLMKTFRDRRLLDLADCNGLVLLRSNAADPVRRLVINSQFDLGEVQESAKRNVPWVLVDLVGEGAPPIQNVADPDRGRGRQGLAVGSAQGDGSVTRAGAARKPPRRRRPIPGFARSSRTNGRIFFGRESIIVDVVGRMGAQNLVFVHGGSGCGKSSPGSRRHAADAAQRS